MDGAAGWTSQSARPLAVLHCWARLLAMFSYQVGSPAVSCGSVGQETALQLGGVTGRASCLNVAAVYVQQLGKTVGKALLWTRAVGWAPRLSRVMV